MRHFLKSLRELLLEKRFLHFLVVGGSGVLLNVATAWLLTRFVFGLDGYFYGYLGGLAANILYNFALHTEVTFGTRTGHARRFALFSAYSAGYAFVQAALVTALVELLGREYYLIVIAGSICFLSVANFLVFRHFIFFERVRSGS